MLINSIMDPVSGPSRPKRLRNVNRNKLTEADIEEELFTDCSSNDDFDMGDLDDSSEESEEEGELTITNVVVMSEPSTQSSTAIDSTHKSSAKPSSGGSSLWTTTCELQDLEYTKQNAFLVSLGHTPIDFFNFFFDNNFLKMICKRTNKQAARLLSGVGPGSRIVAWKPLNISEIKIFLGLLFHMGTISLSRIQDYWKTNRLFSVPIFAKYMSRNRFLLIMRCLYFASDTPNDDDPLSKIRSVNDYFNNKMENYYPARELSLDESMVLWRGRLRFRQYIKNKRHKYGIMLYMLTEPNGLVLKFQVYAGSQDPEVSGKGHAEKVVMSLLEEKLHSGHSVYMDNYYNSYGLAKWLLQNNTYCTGILHSNLKDNPKEVVQKSLRKGENISHFRKGVHIGKWKDKRTVMYITTQYKDRNVAVANSRGQIREKPEAIAKYNEFMSSIKRQDQLLAYYPLERKILRWYLKLAIHTFQIMLKNSFKLFNKFSGQPQMTLYDYRLSVISDLLPENDPIEPSSTTTRSTRKVQHKIIRISEKNMSGKTKRKLCREFSKSKKRKDTVWHCKTCVDHPGLCVECFEKYHCNL